jgi:hypothetical protein
VISTAGMIPHRSRATLRLISAAPLLTRAPDSTPEPPSRASDIDQALTSCSTRVERLPHAAEELPPIHQVEAMSFRDLLALGLVRPRACWASSGEGDVRPTPTRLGEGPDEPPQVPPRLDSPRGRPDQSRCAEVTIERVGHANDRRDAAPWDARSPRPRRPSSAWLPNGRGVFVIEDAHAAAVRKLPTIRGSAIPVQASADLNRERASDGERFQECPPVPEPSPEASIVVVTADGQRVPRVRSAWAGVQEESTAEETRASSPRQRRGQRENAHTKRLAAVGAVSTIDPLVRATDAVIDEWSRKPAAPRRPGPRRQRARADWPPRPVSLFLGLADEWCRRNPEGTQSVVFLGDGERALPDRPGEDCPENATRLLDRLDVLERLGKVAWCLFAEGTPKAEAEPGVEDRPRRLREGKGGSVIGGPRPTRTKRKRTGSGRETAQEVLGYFQGNRGRRGDDEDLAAGYPIGGGVIAGACRHLVEDRLERAGRRWIPDGAQALLDLRATYHNGEWEAFGGDHVEQEEDRLHRKLGKAG